MGINLLKVRAESFPISDISKHPDYPKEFINKEFNIEVHQGLDIQTIKALSNESILVSLERSGYIIHTACRGGSCGVCRIKVISGDYFIPKENDKRRYTDKEYNYVHSCSTYPLSDMKIKINII